MSSLSDSGGGGSSSPSGVLQVVQTNLSTHTTLTTTIPADDTLPQSSEGHEVLTRAITPESASSELLIEANLKIVLSGTQFVTVALFKDSDADALATTLISGASGDTHNAVLWHKEAAGSTSARTYKIRVGPNTGTAYLHGGGGGRALGGSLVSSLKVSEIL